MLKAFATITLAALVFTTSSALEFALKNNNDSSIIGPFELAEGCVIELGGTTFIVSGIDKYGSNTFTLYNDGNATNYGPFPLKANSRVSIGCGSYTMLIVERNDKNARAEPVPTAKGTLDSDKLINFENALDDIESGFTNALRTPGHNVVTTDYENKLVNFRLAARDLQSDIEKTGLDLDADISNESRALASSYEDAKKQYKDYADKTPWIISTRRNGRQPGGQPTAQTPSTREDVYIKQDYSECRVIFDIDSYYYKELRKIPYTSTDDKHDGALDFVRSVKFLRQMIMKLEKSGAWNTAARNGKTFYIKTPADSTR